MPRKFSIESISYVIKGICAKCENIAIKLH
jgi:hypothetical protein